MYLNTFDKFECFGCTACQHVCRQSAISMIADEEGFYYPSRDSQKCNGCGLCERICPAVNPIFDNSQLPKVFAAYDKNVVERKKSTSGGLFYLFAKHVIHNGGVVFGATLDNLKVFHKAAFTLSDLDSLRGSKYVQSMLGDTFRIVKKTLQEGLCVLFSGTPCQVAGLKAYLRKEYTNLLTIDLVCHGVPSPALFDKHIEYIAAKYKIGISNYCFRDNEKWMGCEIIEYYHPDGIKHFIKNPTYELSPYLFSFIRSYTCRYSCYKCVFSTIPRQGDITLGDFWGINRIHPKIDYSKGVSLVLLNTEKGINMWNSIKSSINYVESNLREATLYNKALVTSSEQPAIRSIVYKEINTNGYSYVANTLFRNPNKVKIFFIKCGLFYKLLRIKSVILKFFN